MTVPPPGYGENEPRLVDDRLPVVLVVLDGLGDRAVPELDDRTPAEAASTPVLDALAGRGASGWHLPFGWGRAASSELAHWAMFGYAEVPFPGRAVLEALGAGVDVPLDVAVTHAALRTSVTEGGKVWITGRVPRDDPGDTSDATELMAALVDDGVPLTPLGAGEGLLALDGDGDGALTDSDPFFPERHPWLRVRALAGGCEEGAEALNQLLARVAWILEAHPVNAARRHHGLPAFDVLTTKWSGCRRALPAFVEHAGVAGAAVTSTRLYRGLAGLLGMATVDLAPRPDVGADLAARLIEVEGLIDRGARFVHVHTKATDDAGHTKHPRAKLQALEAADTGLAGLHDLARRAVVAVTGDHATPSVDGVLHTGDPTPLVVAGPTVRRDGVTRFGETPARHGWYGRLAARELLPLLFGHANRPDFLGHRPVPYRTLALPDDPEPMPPIDPRFSS